MTEFPDTHHDATSNSLFGLWIYLMTDFILFASLFAAYAVLRQPWHFDLPFALTQTIVLLVSSFTCGLALLCVPNSQKKALFWYGITFVLGLAFVAMELYDFSQLMSKGKFWSTNAFFSSYFTLAGIHALHIVFALLLLIVFVGQLLQMGFTKMVIRRLTGLSIFWFFSYVVWIFMFTIVYLMGGA